MYTNFSSTADIIIIIVLPMVTIPEDDGTVEVCYMIDTGISKQLDISVTSSVKSPGSPNAACECVAMH